MKLALRELEEEIDSIYLKYSKRFKLKVRIKLYGLSKNLTYLDILLLPSKNLRNRQML